MAERNRDYYDDDDFADIRQKREAGERRFVLLTAAGVGLLLLVILVVIVGGILYAFSESTATRVTGVWSGQFVLPNEKINAIYTFNKDGTFREDDVVDGRKVRTSTGRWEVRDGRVEIEWDHGGFECAIPSWIDDNTMEWHIVDHNDQVQIGSKTLMRRK